MKLEEKRNFPPRREASLCEDVEDEVGGNRYRVHEVRKRTGYGDDRESQRRLITAGILRVKGIPGLGNVTAESFTIRKRMRDLTSSKA